MCGIVGIVSKRRRGDIARIAARMNDAIIHRGPDDCGSWIDGDVALAMRRLSIIDIVGGHQPMLTDDGIAMVFNGEIYNYRKLRDELVARGYRFKTRSDTEVVLNLYHADGRGGLDRLNGMFAIAIVDRRSNELILMRDHAGMKPLYVATIGDEIIFASELKAIIKGLDAKPAINEQAIYDFLTLRYVPQPETVWQGIVKLLPAHRLIVDLRTRAQTLERWWTPDFTPQPAEPGRDYAGEFERLFFEAVESHLTASDVPVGAFLSGGLDSAAIVAVAAELGFRDLHTFSITGEDAGDADELPDARLISSHIGTRHHEIVMTKRDFDELTDLCVYQMDEPYADPTAIAMYMLSRVAVRHVKVGLSGEGADELLLGYTTAKHLAHIDRVRSRFSPWPAWLLRAASHVFTGRRSDILRQVAADGWRGYVRVDGLPADVFSDEHKERFWRGSRQRDSRRTNLREFTLSPSEHPIVQTQQADIQSWLVEDLLMKADKMTMSVSLEGRMPFLHKPLMEWCMRSPLEVRLTRDASGALRSKAVLRDMLARRLPAAILSRPKRGFPLPYERWLSADARGGGVKFATSRFLPTIVDVDAVRAIMGDAACGDAVWAPRIWSLRVLDRWLAINVD